MELSTKAAKAWNKLSDVQRNKYKIMADADAQPQPQPQAQLQPQSGLQPNSNASDACCPKKRRSRPKACCSSPKPRCPMRKKPKCKPKPRCSARPRCARKPRCAPRRKTCPKPRCRPKRKPACKPKCQNPGPVTNNGYLNFLREYRRKHCGLKPKDMVMKAARAWCRLPECKKDEYRRQACKVTKSCRHKRRQKTSKDKMAAQNVFKPQKSMLRGPCANNGFLTFMAQYAVRHGKKFATMFRGGKEWNRMTPAQKDKYRKIKKPINLERDEVPDVSAFRQDEGCCPRKRKPSCPKPRCAPKKKRCGAKPRCSAKPRCAQRPRCAPKSRCARKRKSCPKPRCRPKRKARCGKVKCQSPGPITNNGYLNFVRVYRRKHCGLKPKDLVMKAARAWCRLAECKKDRYRRQACKVTKSCRHKRRRVCTSS
ncbi:hypothetical protein ACLKA7_002612 [Drosophila subpalustris]